VKTGGPPDPLNEAENKKKKRGEKKNVEKRQLRRGGPNQSILGGGKPSQTESCPPPTQERRKKGQKPNQGVAKEYGRRSPNRPEKRKEKIGMPREPPRGDEKKQKDSSLTYGKQKKGKNQPWGVGEKNKPWEKFSCEKPGPQKNRISPSKNARGRGVLSRTRGGHQKGWGPGLHKRGGKKLFKHWVLEKKCVPKCQLGGKKAHPNGEKRETEKHKRAGENPHANKLSFTNTGPALTKKKEANSPKNPGEKGKKKKKPDPCPLWKKPQPQKKSPGNPTNPPQVGFFPEKTVKPPPKSPMAGCKRGKRKPGESLKNENPASQPQKGKRLSEHTVFVWFFFLPKIKHGKQTQERRKEKQWNPQKKKSKTQESLTKSLQEKGPLSTGKRKKLNATKNTQTQIRIPQLQIRSGDPPRGKKGKTGTSPKKRVKGNNLKKWKGQAAPSFPLWGGHQRGSPGVYGKLGPQTGPPSYPQKKKFHCQSVGGRHTGGKFNKKHPGSPT